MNYFDVRLMYVYEIYVEIVKMIMNLIILVI